MLDAIEVNDVTDSLEKMHDHEQRFDGVIAQILTLALPQFVPRLDARLQGLALRVRGLNRGLFERAGSVKGWFFFFFERDRNPICTSFGGRIFSRRRQNKKKKKKKRDT